MDAERAVSSSGPAAPAPKPAALSQRSLRAHRRRTLWEDAKNLLPVEITSAVALDASVAERIGEEIGRQTGRTVRLSSSVDPDVIGGIVVRVGNSILDASIRARLEHVRKQVVKA